MREEHVTQWKRMYPMFEASAHWKSERQEVSSGTMWRILIWWVVCEQQEGVWMMKPEMH